MSDHQMTTQFYKPGGVLIGVGPMFGRKSHALTVSRDGSTSHRALAYFRTPEDAEEFKDVMRELLAGRLIKEPTDD